MARIDDDGERVYFTDTEGARWRVYDVAFGPPLCQPILPSAIRPPDARAALRYFVTQYGLELCHRFTDGEPLELTP